MSRRDTENRFEMFAEADGKFFLKAEDIQFAFTKDAAGTVTGVVVDQGDGTVYEVLKGQRVK
jgi:hypothetical protein